MIEQSSLSVTGEHIPTRVVGAVDAEVDGDRILLSPKDFTYFGATGTGDRIWDMIDGQRNVNAIVAELEATYQAPPGVIGVDTVEYIDALAAAGLVELR